MNTQDRGANIQAPSNQPSVNLAKLIELLADSVAVSGNFSRFEDPDPKQRSLFLFNPQRNRLRICTSAVLLRLFSHPQFCEAFKSGDSSGFIRDFEPPSFGLQAKLGGELTAGNRERLPGHLDRLMATINQVLDLALPEGELSKLLLDDPVQQLRTLASAAEAKFRDAPHQAKLQSLKFAPGAQKVPDSAVAKVLSAVERIEADDCFTRMQDAIAVHLEQRDAEEDEIESAIASLVAERERADSQIVRFLNFLDSEALARVRLSVAVRLMEAIADHARSSTQAKNQKLVEYVDRVVALIETSKAGELYIDLTAFYGERGEFDLQEFLNQATFFHCLSVWPEGKAQMFEKKGSSQASYGVQREVSYRFRINGNNPETKKPAFDTRLDKLEEALLGKNRVGSFSRRRLAELLVLDAVIPSRTEANPETSVGAIAAAIQSRISTLKQQENPSIQAFVRDLLQDLRSRASTMTEIANALIDLLKRKGSQILAQTQRRTAQQFICVKHGIVAWNRLEGAEPGVRDLLKSSQNQSEEKIEWFKYLEISDSPDVPQLLFSVKVTTELAEHNLVIKEQEAQTIQAQRRFSGRLLQVLWVPYEASKNKEYVLTESAKIARSWALPAAVQVEYEIRTLARNKKNSNENTHQLHAAAITAFTVLTYCCLWRLIKRLQALPLDDSHSFTTLMLRLQEAGKDSESEGDSYVYAAAQSIEAMLAQDTAIRMQGVTLKNLTSGDSSVRYVKSGSFDAMLSSFPLRVATENTPAVEQIGLISYSTRPCDEMPFLDRDSSNHLLMTQSYTASAINQPFPGYELKAERMQSDIVSSQEELQKQRLVREEIGHLKGLGCQHIILISHAYGSRHLNRAADYNSLLTPVAFLEEVFQTFPELTIYPMLRDVFPATRLRKRGSGEAAFEIRNAGDHIDFQRNLPIDSDRDIIPIYTFATLHVVEEEKRPQSGFCAYYLVSDRRVTDITWTERARQHLLNPEGNSPVHPCLVSVLRGLHFMEAERGVKGGQLMPVLDPFSWISPTTKAAAGEVEILQSRRKGRSYLSYPAILTHVAQVLHRRQQ
ncbi:hypothetical protein IQ241_14025 [Romeria aff. gracilis LEGE 07310]|uniref:Uncharacterized protein n=1 Tax=Vasconcelosia minhoensis LEGE 07310 TaxID=915328 RepID=A0A8J7APT8_9CYAN|nr:hypothetical protein [Romeria gracilis]MBE9078399.1 hypothetical protein [Romeria aff. gracilis LEGE 07310]